MGADHGPLATLTVRELIDMLAGTEGQIRLLRREASSTGLGTDHTDHGPKMVRALLRRQNQVIVELRRRRSRTSSEQQRRPGTLGAS